MTERVDPSPIDMMIYLLKKKNNENIVNDEVALFLGATSWSGDTELNILKITKLVCAVWPIAIKL